MMHRLGASSLRRVIDDGDRVMLVEKTVLVDDADLKAALGSRPWPAHGL
jgi:hypothetical protein